MRNEMHVLRSSGAYNQRKHQDAAVTCGQRVEGRRHVENSFGT